MSAEHQPGGDQAASEELDAAKERLMAAWQQVPREQRAGMVMALIATVMDTKQGPALREAIDKRWPMETKAQGEFFVAVRIHRGDLERLQFSSDEIAQLSDDDMERIAEKVWDYYVTGEFWEDLNWAAKSILKEKGREGRGGSGR